MDTVQMKNTKTGQTRAVAGSFTWLWALLFGPIYYAAKGMWGYFVISMFPLAFLFLAFFSKGALIRKYEDMDWVRVDGVAK